jgi:FAD:protein FMN transferase
VTTGQALTSRVAFRVMGTMASMVVAPTDVENLGLERVEAALATARGVLDGLEQRFSHYRHDSEISRWVAGDELPVEAVADIEHVLRQCGRLHAESDGTFRARNPRTHALDTAGYVKGYAIGRAAECLAASGLRNFVVGVGGDVQCSGRAGVDRPWRVAIQDPRRSHAVLALVEATDLAVATSGTAERGDHIWGPAAGPSSGLASFTVVGPDIAEADAYATIGFAMGEQGAEWVRSREGYRSLLVRTDGSVRTDAALVSAG